MQYISNCKAKTLGGNMRDFNLGFFPPSHFDLAFPSSSQFHLYFRSSVFQPCLFTTRNHHSLSSPWYDNQDLQRIACSPIQLLRIPAFPTPPILVFLSCYMNHSCKSKYCNKAFNTPGGLSAHRTRCEHYKRHEAAALERRKENVKAKRAGAVLATLARANNDLTANEMMQVSQSPCLRDVGR